MAGFKKKGKPFQPVEKPEEFADTFSRYMEAIKPTTKLNPNDVEEMRQRFANFINATNMFGMEFTNQAYYGAMGFTARQLEQYVGPKYNDNPERGQFLRWTKWYLAAYREQSIAKGYLDSKAGMFWQKNYDGLKDAQEIVVQSNEPEVRTMKEIQERYQDVVDVEFEVRKSIPEKTSAERAPRAVETQKDRER